MSERYPAASSGSPLRAGAAVCYTRDMLGRMLTRTTSSPATTVKFEWDGWDCIREYTAPSGTATCDSAHVDTDAHGSAGVTLCYVVNGELLAFERDNATYQVHADALGSVRMVTGSDGATLARFDYDAWGNSLSSTFNNVPGGMPYRFVGSLGVRWDEETGLYYMRNRWYEPGLAGFVSRDRVSSLNRYNYALNSPSNCTDATRLDPEQKDPFLEKSPQTIARHQYMDDETAGMNTSPSIELQIRVTHAWPKGAIRFAEQEPNSLVKGHQRAMSVPPRSNKTKQALLNKLNSRTSPIIHDKFGRCVVACLTSRHYGTCKAEVMGSRHKPKSLFCSSSRHDPLDMIANRTGIAYSFESNSNEDRHSRYNKHFGDTHQQPDHPNPTPNDPSQIRMK